MQNAHDKEKSQLIKVWDKSIASFMYPVFLFILLMLHVIYVNGSPRSAFFLLSLTVIFAIGAYFLYDNERLSLYSNRMEYKYGIWNPEPYVLNFGSRSFSIVLPEKKHLLQKLFKYQNLLIVDSDGKIILILRNIRNATEFYHLFSDTVNAHLKAINPNYQIIPEKNTAKEAGFFEQKAKDMTGSSQE